MEDAPALVFRLHGVALRVLASHLGFHPQGLAGAAPAAQRRGLIGHTLTSKLVRTDEALAILRHVTAPY
eukprot:7878089-Prorocentrum_lima.AAC.1